MMLCNLVDCSDVSNIFLLQGGLFYPEDEGSPKDLYNLLDYTTAHSKRQYFTCLLLFTFIMLTDGNSTSVKARSLR
jgi:hypothetical protein